MSKHLTQKYNESNDKINNLNKLIESFNQSLQLMLQTDNDKIKTMFQEEIKKYENDKNEEIKNIEELKILIKNEIKNKEDLIIKLQNETNELNKLLNDDKNVDHHDLSKQTAKKYIINNPKNDNIDNYINNELSVKLNDQIIDYYDTKYEKRSNGGVVLSCYGIGSMLHYDLLKNKEYVVEKLIKNTGFNDIKLDIDIYQGDRYCIVTINGPSFDKQVKEIKKLNKNN
jgi:hypothetical protein